MTRSRETDSESNRIVIFGAGDIARLALYYFRVDSPFQPVACTVDDDYCTVPEFQGLPLVRRSEIVDRYPPAEYRMFIALSYTKMNQFRAGVFDSMRALGYRFVSYVSSHATNLTEYPIGENCFILEDNTVQPFVRIGENVTCWSGNHLGHDATIGDHCFVSSHVVISGHVRVERCSFLGVNSTIRNGVTIGESSLIGAGAVIMKSTEPHSVYVPERAKKLPIPSSRAPL